jgi:predicted esterase
MSTAAKSLGRILCLHGYVQNGNMFAKKTSAIRKALDKMGFETVYLTGPVKIEVSDLSFEVNNEGGREIDNMRSWWPNSESNPEHLTIDMALDEIIANIDQEGPFVGVLGFSQGAALAAILCQIIHTVHESQQPLKFGLFYSGFRSRLPAYAKYYERPISVPSIHVIGTLDTVVEEERTMKLYDACEPSKRVLLTHPGGHFVPNAKDILTKVVAFVQNAMSESRESESEIDGVKAEERDNWDEFDIIGAR